MAVKLLTVEDERNSLRCVDCSLGKLHHSQALLLRCIGSLLEAVAQTVVVMAADIAHMLERIVGPCFHGDLRMLDSTGDTELDIRLVSGNSVHESRILASERAAHGITDIVAERADLVKHVCIRLECDFLCRICRSLSGPTLAVDHHIRIDGMQALADLVHRVDVMDGHEVETEAVDMIFLHPPFERLDHVLAEHLLLRCSLVAAARAVEECAVLTHAVEIARHGAFETGVGSVCGVVIHHIQNHAETGLVESLDHLLELPDPGHRVIRVCRERTLDSVIVERLISPVVLVVLETGLVNGREIGRRQKLDICHAKLLEVVDACRKTVRILRTLFCKGKILSLVFNT